MKRALTDEERLEREIAIFETILPMKKKTKKIFNAVCITLLIAIAALVILGVV